MEQLDLDINNYEFEDILNLFKLDADFDENDLKYAKQIVLKTHPDKSRLDSKYFIFYSKAYKVLFSIYEFRNKTTNKKEENYTDLSSNEKTVALDNFFEKNKLLQKTSNFNKWFNEQFEKNKISSDSGYGEWLRSDEDIEEAKIISKSDMATEFAKKKQQVRSLVVHQGINDNYVSNISGSSLNCDGASEYSSDLFSNLAFQDLKQAHTETVVPVTEEDYHKVKKFKDVNEFMRHRDSQNEKPLSEQQAINYLKTRTFEDDKQASKRAYDLAKQVEQSKERNKKFWGNIMNLTN